MFRKVMNVYTSRVTEVSMLSNKNKEVK